MMFGIVKTRLRSGLSATCSTAAAYALGPASVAGGAAFRAGIGGRAVAGVPELDHVRDAGAVAVTLHHVDLVPAPLEVADPRSVEVVFHRDAAGARVDREAR